MVLEHIFPEDWLEKKPLYAFLLGAAYSAIGILAAKLLFPRDPALVAVAFISVLLLPELRKIFSLEERQERREKRFSWRHLWKDDRDVALVYLSLFLGVFSVYILATAWLPAFSVNGLFRQQLAYRGAAVGHAAWFSPAFGDILWNNLLVLGAIFLFGLLAGDGAVFLITWNASVWGTVFGALAREAAGTMGMGLFPLLGIVLVIVLPHMLLEGLSYILAAISGSVISKDVENERLNSTRFKKILSYNIMLLFFALAILLIGVAVESWVLQHVDLYKEIILASYS